MGPSAPPPPPPPVPIPPEPIDDLTIEPDLEEIERLRKREERRIGLDDLRIDPAIPFGGGSGGVNV